MICVDCHRDLPETEYSPSRIKNKWYICHKCYNKRAKEWKINKILSEETEKDFNRFYGGILIKVLNYQRKGEYKYHIKSTEGFYYNTNQKEEFLKELKKILDF